MSGYSIQQIGPMQSYNAQFQGQQMTTNTYVPYYHSNTGVKAAALLSIPAALDFLPDLRLRNNNYFENNINTYKQDSEMWKKDIDKLVREAKFSENINNQLKKYKAAIPDIEAYRKTCMRRMKIAIPATLLAMGCTIGSGMLIDGVRNSKAKETAEQYAFSAYPGAASNIRNACIAESGIPYYKSNTGKIFGIGLGAVCGVISAFLNGGMSKTSTNVILRTIAFALGGLASGAIYDNVVNRRARKAANNL